MATKMGMVRFEAIFSYFYSTFLFSYQLRSYIPLFLDSQPLTSPYEPFFKSYALALFSDTVMTPSVYVWLCMGFLDWCDWTTRIEWRERPPAQPWQPDHSRIHQDQIWGPHVAEAWGGERTKLAPKPESWTLWREQWGHIWIHLDIPLAWPASWGIRTIALGLWGRGTKPYKGRVTTQTAHWGASGKDRWPWERKKGMGSKGCQG